MTTWTVYKTSYNDKHEEYDRRKLLSTSVESLALDAALTLELNAQEEGLQRQYDVVETEDEVVGWVA